MINIILLLITLIIAVVAIILSVIAFGKYNNLQKKYDIFMQGKDAETLEDFCLNLQKNIDVFMEDREKTRENIKKLNRITKRSIQKIGIHRYNALEENTGKRSFVIALLDFTNTGFVITFQSLGDGTIMFIKEIEGGATNTKLGPEEQKAVEIALGTREKFED